MIRLKSLPENANVYEVFANNPAYLAAAGPRIRDQGYSGSLKKFSAE